MSEESGQETTTEALAAEVGMRLRKFAAADSDTQKAHLGELIGFIKEYVTSEVLSKLANQEFQTNLEEAVAATLETPIDVEGQEVFPWKGSYTLVAINEDGSIEGAVSERPDDMTPYGDPDFNLHAPALVKAVSSMYLNKAGIQGGITDNKRHLREITNGQFSVHTGATDEPISLHGKRVYIGSSGCEAAMDSVSRVLDGAIPTHFTQAGAFDEAFVGITGTYLTNPARDTAPIISRPIDRLTTGN